MTTDPVRRWELYIIAGAVMLLFLPLLVSILLRLMARIFAIQQSNKQKQRNERKRMTKTHQNLVAALLPFCLQKTKELREAIANPATSGAEVKRLRDYIAGQRGTLVGSNSMGYTKELVGLLAVVLGKPELNEAVNASRNGGVSYPAGSVVVVVSGDTYHKRVVGKPYIVTSGSGDQTKPCPLGLRGDWNARKFNDGGRTGEIKPATDAQVSECLANLKAPQIKTLVCVLSGYEPFKTALAEVITNPENDCNC